MRAFFEPTMTREQWSLLQVKQEKRDSGELLKEMLVFILQEETDENILDELSKAITKRKTELHNAS